MRAAALRILAATLPFLLAAGVARAADDPREGDRRIGKGATEWALLAGGGVAHRIWGGVADRSFVLAGGRISRVLGDPAGPGVLRGHFAVGVELLPVFVVFQESTTAGASFTLLFRHYLAPERAVRPFVSFGAGGLLTGRDVPPGTSRWNFTPQAGLGLAIPGRRVVYQIEYRIHHISNASLAASNPGINSSYVQFALAWFR